MSEKRRSKSANIVAKWCGPAGNVTSRDILRPGKVWYFMRHTVVVDGQVIEHQLAKVKWFEVLESNQHSQSPLIDCKLSGFVEAGAATYMPVQRICNKYAYIEKKNDLIVIPMYSRVQQI